MDKVDTAFFGSVAAMTFLTGPLLAVLVAKKVLSTGEARAALDNALLSLEEMQAADAADRQAIWEKAREYVSAMSTAF